MTVVCLCLFRSILYLLLFPRFSSLTTLSMVARRSTHRPLMKPKSIDDYIQRISVSTKTPISGTELELLILSGAKLPTAVTSSDSYAEIAKVCESFGRQNVDEAMQRFQRLIQQLDRSDGRSDISYDVLSDRFYDFCGTCLRTKGEAWMAAIARLEFIGIVMNKFVINERNNSKEIDIGLLLYTSARLLLDLDGPKFKKIADVGDSVKQGKMKDLMVGVIRLAMRQIVAGEGERSKDAFILKLLYPTKLEPESLTALPSIDAIKCVLELDVGCSYSWTEETGIFEISADSIGTWRDKLCNI